MRFSLKWTFVATAWAAVACASIHYADAWGVWVAQTLLALLLVLSAVGGLAARGVRQAFFLGALCVYLMVHFGSDESFKNVARSSFQKSVSHLHDLALQIRASTGTLSIEDAAQGFLDENFGAGESKLLNLKIEEGAVVLRFEYHDGETSTTVSRSYLNQQRSGLAQGQRSNQYLIIHNSLAFMLMLIGGGCGAWLRTRSTSEAR